MIDEVVAGHSDPGEGAMRLWDAHDRNRGYELHGKQERLLEEIDHRGSLLFFDEAGPEDEQWIVRSAPQPGAVPS